MAPWRRKRSTSEYLPPAARADEKLSPLWRVFWVEYRNSTTKHTRWQVTHIEELDGGWTRWHLQCQQDEDVMDVPPGATPMVWVPNEQGGFFCTYWPIQPYRHYPLSFETARDKNSPRPLSDPLTPREIKYATRKERLKGTLLLLGGTIVFAFGMMQTIHDIDALSIALIGAILVAAGVYAFHTAKKGFRVYGDLDKASSKGKPFQIEEDAE